MKRKRILFTLLATFGATVVVSIVIMMIWGMVWSGKKDQPQAAGMAAPRKVDIRLEPEPAPKEEAGILETTVNTVTSPFSGEKKQEDPRLAKMRQFVEQGRNGKGGHYKREDNNGSTSQLAGGSVSSCEVIQSVKGYGMIAEPASTDRPGEVLAIVSEDIIGKDTRGHPCLAVPGGETVLVLESQGAGEYATSKADFAVKQIQLPDGAIIDAKSNAGDFDGSRGVTGKANHHVASNTLATLGYAGYSIVRGLAPGSWFGGASQALDPIAEATQKKLKRPSEIQTARGTPISFTLHPFETKGY